MPNLSSALKAVDAGVDGLIVEGGEGGGFKNPDDVSTLVLLQAVRERTDVPIIAAGGICDGRGMAAAFALGAEGIQMGTRFVSAAESPVHANYKQAIVDADDTGTVMLNRKSSPCVRALKTERAKAIDREGSFDRAIFKERHGRLFRRRHGGLAGARRPDRRPDPRGAAGRRHHRPHGRGLPRHPQGAGRALAGRRVLSAT